MHAEATRAEVALVTSPASAQRSTAPVAVHLRCPRCSANLFSLSCAKCGMEMRESDGIVHALRPERVEHYARFIAEYEHIRAEEGRGSKGPDFYFDLPYRDATGRNEDQWRIRSRTYQYMLDRILTPTLPLGAKILDLGAGNCWLSHRLARAGYSMAGVDLLTNPYDGLAAANHYRRYLPELFPRFQAELEHLPFQDQQFDAAVFNASFHYAEDAVAALAEALRCTKRDGFVVIGDTPWYSCEASGFQMVKERRQSFLWRFGTASASLESIEFVTDDRLRSLERRLGIQWKVYSPKYGVCWAMRPYLAKLRKRREPAQFRIYVTQRAET
jgi:SAM-dependent methyltransferase